MSDERKFAKEVLDLAIKKGSDVAEVYIKSSKKLSIEVKNQKIDALESSLSFGYSLRVIKERALGFSYSTDRGNINSVVDNAVEASRCADKDEYLEMPEACNSISVDIFDPEISAIEEDEAIKKVCVLENAAYEVDNRIKKIRKALGTFSHADVVIMNSKGINTYYSSTTCIAQIIAVAENGTESQMGWDFAGSRFLKEVSFEEVGQNAARHAVQLLGSKRINSVKAHVILDRSVAADFMEVFSSSFSSEHVQKGKSLLAGKIGKQVLSPKINVVDNGLLSGRLGSKPVDDEGVPSREKILIKEGVLQGYLYNMYTANKDGVSSTGNALRNRFSGLPSVGISNLSIEAVSRDKVLSLNELFKAADKGLYITGAMGIHTVNPVSGEFSTGVSGLWIENGEIKFPVKETVISGNLLSLFERIEAVGDDYRFYGNIGVPSLLIGPIDISA